MTTATLSIPPLRQGERLSEDEFMRRYEAMPDIKAELLDGVVYMSLPVTYKHGCSSSHVSGWLGYYSAFTAGVEGAINGTVRLCKENIPQPDHTLRILELFGGNATIDEDDFLAGPPEFVIEISVNSFDYDRAVKLPIYQKAGIREYFLWRVNDAAIDWYVLKNGVYEQLPIVDGIVRSRTFPGLWLDVEAMIRDDGVSVMRVLQKGIDSAEHARFVAALQAAQQSKA